MRKETTARSSRETLHAHTNSSSSARVPSHGAHGTVASLATAPKSINRSVPPTSPPPECVMITTVRGSSRRHHLRSLATVVKTSIQKHRRFAPLLFSGLVQLLQRHFCRTKRILPHMEPPPLPLCKKITYRHAHTTRAISVSSPRVPPVLMLYSGGRVSQSSDLVVVLSFTHYNTWIATAPSSLSSSNCSPRRLLVSYACAKASGDPLVPIVNKASPAILTPHSPAPVLLLLAALAVEAAPPCATGVPMNWLYRCRSGGCGGGAKGSRAGQAGGTGVIREVFVRFFLFGTAYVIMIIKFYSH